MKNKNRLNCECIACKRDPHNNDRHSVRDPRTNTDGHEPAARYSRTYRY